MYSIATVFKLAQSAHMVGFRRWLPVIGGACKCFLVSMVLMASVFTNVIIPFNMSKKKVSQSQEMQQKVLGSLMKHFLLGLAQ